MAKKTTQPAALPSMGGEVESKPQEPKAVAAAAVVEVEPVAVMIELDVFPCFIRGAHTSRFLNMTKRLTGRQSKALKALANIHDKGNAAAVQILLDKVADAIEEQHNVTL